MPVPGHESFEQWRAAIAALVRKPIGFPGYMRQRVGDIHSFGQNIWSWETDNISMKCLNIMILSWFIIYWYFAKLSQLLSDAGGFSMNDYCACASNALVVKQTKTDNAQ